MQNWNHVIAAAPMMPAQTAVVNAFLAIGFGAAAYKCWTLTRRATTNSKCVLSLMLVFLAMAAGQFVAAMVLLMPQRGGTAAVIPGLLGLGIFAALGTAVVFAIWGLCEYSGEKDKYSQGRKQAIWTLVLSAVMVAFGVAGVVRGVQRGAAMKVQPVTGQPLVRDDYNFKFNAPGRPWVQFDVSKFNRFAQVGFMRSGPTMQCMVVAE
ncbi:MAG TPA: hypothetical protein VK530_11505, partial [Candidatus Acidoferrum sp.]|nr:hypothetical protein [Candidatus Acidoferrum sp.]